MHVNRIPLVGGVILGLVLIGGVAQLFLGPPSDAEIDLWAAQIQHAIESGEWSQVEPLLDPKTCPHNLLYQESLQTTLTKYPERRIVLTAITAHFMRNVDCPCVQGFATLSYLDSSGLITESERFSFYGVKHSGRIWLDCGNS